MTLLFRLLTLVVIICIHNSIAQNNTVHGTITNNSTPISKVTITNKTSFKNSSSDVYGNYTIIAQKGDTLSFSLLGFQSVEKTVANSNLLNIEMVSNTFIDEVILTALGVKRKKESLGYSTQSLYNNDITTVKSTNITNGLSGKIAGVNIVNSSGAVGAESSITIRGLSSISGNNQPLIIVDGIVIDNNSYGDSNDSFGVSNPNGLADLNDDDIESIQVLKGGAASALYGMRATNGVILITTKSAEDRTGKLNIEFSSNITIDNIYILPDLQNAYGQGNSSTYFEFIDGINGDGGFDESWGPRLDAGLEFIQWNSNNGEALPWVSQPNNIKNFYQTGLTTDNNVAFSIGNTIYNTRFSLGYSDQSGTIPNTDLKKYNIAGNFNYNFSSKLSAGINIKYIKSKSKNLPSVGYDDTNNQIAQLIWNGRNVDLDALKDYDNLETTTANGSEVPVPTNWNLLYYNNPYWALENNTNSFLRDRIIGGIDLNYNINHKLSLKTQTGIDYFESLNTKQRAFGTNGHINGYYQETERKRYELNLQTLLSYKNNITKDINLNINFGGSSNTNTYNRNENILSELQVNKLYNLSNIREGATIQTDEDLFETKINSLFGFTEISYKNFLYATITGRNDWASVLSINNNSFFYPSISSSLILTEALNIKSSTVNYLKLRTGWSKTGSTGPLDAYSIKPTYVFSDENWNGTQIASYPETLWNPDIKNEETTEIEIGFETKLFKNRLYLDFTYYNKNSYNIITKKSIDPASGSTFFWDNSADIYNRGIELTLNGRILKNLNGLNLNMYTNFTKNNSKVQNINTPILLGGIWNVDITAQEGEPVGTIFGSVFEKNEEGRIIYENGLPQISDTHEVLGNINPDWTAGFGTNLSYKNFKLTSHFDVKKGGEIYSMTNTWGMYAGTLEESVVGRETGIIGDGVIADGNGGYIENNVIIDAKTFYKSSYSDLIAESSVFDASFVKWRELSLTYDFPKKFLNKNLNDVSISFTARNIAILYKNAPHIDPETSFSNYIGHQGIEYAQIPPTRSFGLGLNVTF